MKKIITTALIAAMLTASLAGCSGNTNSEGNNSSDVNSATQSSADENSSTESSTTESSSTEDDTSAPATDGTSAAVKLQAVFNEFPVFDVSAEAFMSMIVAGPDADALKAVFPDPEDPEKPTHCVFGIEEAANLAPMMGLGDFNFDDCEDYVLAAPMMSASLKRFIIVKPKAGKEDAVKTALSQYAETAKVADPTEYPSWEEERAGTKFGETNDGYFYVVVAAEGADMGAAIANE